MEGPCVRIGVNIGRFGRRGNYVSGPDGEVITQPSDYLWKMIGDATLRTDAFIPLEVQGVETAGGSRLQIASEAADLGLPLPAAVDPAMELEFPIEEVVSAPYSISLIERRFSTSLAGLRLGWALRARSHLGAV